METCWTTKESGRTAAGKLYNDFIMTYGIPEKLLSNRIKELKNEFFFRNTI